jgi:uncharacterized membrane protein
MNTPEPTHGMIGFRTALLLYALLLAGAAYALRGSLRLALLAVIVLLLVKSCLHYFHRRLDRDG